MNLRVWSTAIATVVAGSLFGCQGEEFKTSPDGFKYKYVVKGDGELAKEGEYVVYNLSYRDELDNLLMETTEGSPAMLQCVMEEWDKLGPLYKALKIIKEGDSILVKIPTKTLFAESFQSPVPPTLNPEGEITFFIGAKKYKTQEEVDMEMDEMEKQMMAAREAQVERDVEIIEDYLKSNNIKAQSTESGLRYVIDVEGKGAHPQAGQIVRVHYTGTLMDGAKFDSSYDRNEPISFVLGRRQVIAGWDEGIALFKKGGKGTLYIPSSLAYGERGAGQDIKPNSVLKFEIELVDIE